MIPQRTIQQSQPPELTSPPIIVPKPILIMKYERIIPGKIQLTIRRIRPVQWLTFGIVRKPIRKRKKNKNESLRKRIEDIKVCDNKQSAKRNITLKLDLQ